MNFQVSSFENEYDEYDVAVRIFKGGQEDVNELKSIALHARKSTEEDTMN